jgi:hypothetical protein
MTHGWTIPRKNSSSHTGATTTAASSSSTHSTGCNGSRPSSVKGCISVGQPNFRVSNTRSPWMP